MFGLPGEVTACLFDMDGALTQTAVMHAAAWNETFDDSLRQRAESNGTEFVPFDSHAAYVSSGPTTRQVLDAAGTAGLATELKEHGADTVVEDLADLLQEDGQQDKGAP